MGFDKDYTGARATAEKAEDVKAQVDLLDKLVDKIGSLAGSKGLTGEQLETLLTRVGVTSAEAMRLSLKPENAEPTHLSAFFTAHDLKKYGSWDARPKLTRKTFYCGVEEKDDRLMTSEIEAYNAIVTNRDARNGKWKADVRRVGREEVLDIQMPIQSVDDRMGLPPLLLILHELNGGPDTSDLGGLLRQIEQLKGLAASKGASAADLEAALLAG